MSYHGIKKNYSVAMKLKSFVSDASLANDQRALLQVTLLRRTDTARQWPGTSAASDLREGTLQRHFLTDGPGRCRYDINKSYMASWSIP
jgi:hypothetical protein